MKFISKYYIVMFTVIVTLTSCGDDLLDVNTDPNNPASSTPQLTLPAGQVSMGLTLEADYNLLGNVLAQYWTQGPTASQYSFLETYTITTNSYGGAWSRMYASSLEDLEFVRKQAIEDGLPNYAAVAQIMQAYGFQILVDLYDQVPYSEALQGKDGITRPNYEFGDEIYDDLIVKIDEALTMIDLSPSAVGPGFEDLIYRGNMKTWIKFANTLKLKIYLRQSEARPTVAQAGIQGLYSAGVDFISISEAALISFTNNTSNENPMWQNLNLTTFTNVVASETMTSTLTANGDTRIAALYDVSPNAGTYVGLEQGTGTNSSGVYDDFAVPSFTNIIIPNKPVIIMSGIESLFMQAEAIQRGWGSGSAKQAYDEAVLASYTSYGLDGSNIIAPGGNYEYDNTLEAISYQRWLAFNGTQGFEAWTERGRLGVSDWAAGDGSSVFKKSATSTLTGNSYPVRLVFPSSETASNPNVPPLEDIDSPVWWAN